MCDFICVENMKSLIDHIVTKHLSKPTSPAATTNDDNETPSSEEIANSEAETFKQLRKAYEENQHQKQGGGGGLFHVSSDANIMNRSREGGLMLMNGRGRSILNKKALEDQVSTLRYK